MLLTLSLLTALALVSAQVMNAPPGFVDICKGEDNIIKWVNVPHDWAYDPDNADCCEWKDVPEYPMTFPEVPNCCEGDGAAVDQGDRSYAFKDWWYWQSDWRQKIANGDLESELAAGGDGACNRADKLLDAITFCDPDTDVGCDDSKTVEDKCRQACAFKYSTEDDTRWRCNYFSFSEEDRTCLLFAECGWPFIEDGDIDGVSTAGMETHRVINIYPVGFKPFDLREFNEPPVCIWVPNSGDKKVEVMIETEMNDAAVCIRDGSDLGIGRNADVGNVETCNDGKLEACFTAASDRDQNEDFFFMIYCEGSCEATDIDLWLRIRTSRNNWSYGKTTTEDDIEMWCEMEKGTTSTYTNKKGNLIEMNDYSWPSELLPSKPDNNPFNVQKRNPSGVVGVHASLVAVFVSVAAVILGM